VETAAFYVIREALFNARRHAGASRVSVQVECRQQHLSIRVGDNGVGFAPEAAALVSDRHYGLRSMRERAAALGGALACASAPGEGTRIEAEIPL
jgi:signal transduction histidine kinase